MKPYEIAFEPIDTSPEERTLVDPSGSSTISEAFWSISIAFAV